VEIFINKLNRISVVAKMKFCIYACPNYTENALFFIDKLTSIEGVRFGLICQEPREWMPATISSKLAGFGKVNDVFDENELLEAVKLLQNKHGKVHRLIAAIEQIQVPLAQVRERLGIKGMSVETAINFRDKNKMKEVMRKAGLPCAKHQLILSENEALAFVKKTGYPVVVKPLAGAASQGTYKAGNDKELIEALKKCDPNGAGPILLEEFIQGDEFSFDTFSQKGKSVFHSLTHYYPNPLEVMREPWIQWQVVLPREVDDEKYNDIRIAAAKTLKALGMDTGMSHLEWFRRNDGSIAISEVAARPPGAQITTLISRANDIDCVGLWGRLMIFEKFPKVERKYAAGAAFLRGQGQGKVKAVHGLEQIQSEFGQLITDFRIPKPGQEKSITYEGEGFIILRHPETSVVREALAKIVSTVNVELYNY
jgi:formate-dependent phosphoribosylglycinamide formyltransferase (GAR transformylase)